MQSKFFTQYLLFVLALGVVIPGMAQTPFYIEDFGDETAALANWTSGGENDGTETWQWTDDLRWHGFNLSEFGAPTAANGYIYFSSFDNGFNAHAVTLTSPAIDCSGKDQVFLEMYTQYMYYFYDAVYFGESPVEIGVSTNGTDFVYYPVLLEVDAFDLYVSVQRVVVELPDAINEPEVYIQIKWTGINEVFLNVDDIALYDTEPILANDLQIDNVRIPAAYETPLSQADSLFFVGEVTNNGADPQTNVRMRVSIFGPAGDLVFQDSTENLEMLAAGAVDTLELEQGFLPETVGDYVIVQRMIADETDDFRPDNVDVIEFNITESIFANDNDVFNWPPLIPSGLGDGDFWDGGNFFYVKNGKGFVADSVYFSFYSQNDEHVGQSATIFLYKYVDDGEPGLTDDDVVNVGFSNYEFTASDEPADIVAAPIYQEDGFTVGVPLEDSTDYVLMVSLPSNIGLFYTYRNLVYEFASVVRDNGDWGFFDPQLVMVVRMGIAQGSVPVKEPELADSRISSFPNPTKDFYRIDLDLENTSPVQLQVISTAGQVVMQREYTSLKRDRIDLDVKDFARGMYLVKVRTEEGVKTLKFTKQ